MKRDMLLSKNDSAIIELMERTQYELTAAQMASILNLNSSMVRDSLKRISRKLKRAQVAK